jgi:hypothetical protein
MVRLNDTCRCRTAASTWDQARGPHKPTLCLTDRAENFAVADHLAAQAVGDCLQECVAVTDMQRASGAKYLVELIVGEMNWRHERPPCIVGER